MKYENVKDDIEKIKAMHLSSAFVDLFNKLVDAIKKDDIVGCDIWVNNLYPSIKLEDISSDDKEFLKNFLLEIMV